MKRVHVEHKQSTSRAQAENEPEAKFEFSCLASREAASGRVEWSNGIY